MPNVAADVVVTLTEPPLSVVPPVTPLPEIAAPEIDAPLITSDVRIFVVWTEGVVGEPSAEPLDALHEIASDNSDAATSAHENDLIDAIMRARPELHVPNGSHTRYMSRGTPPAGRRGRSRRRARARDY